MLMVWLLPVGTPGGINSGFDGVPDGSGVVLIGADMVILELDEYRLWQAAASAPEMEELLVWATTQGIAAAESLLRSLIDAGLILEGVPGVESQIGRLTMRLIGECVGNGPAPRTQFTVWGRDRTVLTVNVYLFEMLLRANGAISVVDLCEVIDKARPEQDRRQIELLRDALPLLVSSGVVRLDGEVQRQTVDR
jgi:hypothetical protein